MIIMHHHHHHHNNSSAFLLTSPDLNAVASSALLYLSEFASGEPITPNEGKE
jgi:hypothetical protein